MSTAMDPEVREALAGGYVLGTLEPDERVAVETQLRRDVQLAAAVSDWEVRLAPLAELAPPAEPSPDLWKRIAADTVSAPIPLAPKPKAVAPAVVAPANDAAARDAARVIKFRRSARRWRAVSGWAGMALAASLGVIGYFGPDYLESQRDPGRYVGIVNTGGAGPAIVVSVDTRRGELKIRPLGVQAEAGKSHELWAVRGNSAPVSLGLVDGGGARGLAGLPAEALADPALVLAVSVEPTGGSPTGQPTGPVVFTGKLVKEE